MNARFLLAPQEKLLRPIATGPDASLARNRRNRHPWRLLTSTGPLTISVFSMRSTLNLWALDKRQSGRSTP